MPYYEKHIFFCLNQREAPKQCCAAAGSEALFHYAKSKIKSEQLDKQRNIRVNRAGCLGRCSEGPSLVIYPDGIWYRYETQSDIDEIIKEHLIHGKIVERLRI